MANDTLVQLTGVAATSNAEVAACVSYFSQWVIDLSTICSISGLIVSIYVLYDLQKIKQSFLRKARLPDAYKSLTTINTSLSKSIKNWESNPNEVLEDLAKIRAILGNIHSKLSGEECKQSAKKLMVKLDSGKGFLHKNNLRNLTNNEMWDIYTELQKVIESFNQLIKDNQWD